ncbi:type VI secretion system Vgr family protein [Pseudomonas aeruginosa]|uniref:type VI secretion system Vgr family protein n=1 Tax=Pseudomonas aeruginosa TaxID=287 RepID=UPI00105849C6
MRQRDLKFTFVVGEGKLAFDVVEFELEEALCEPFRLNLKLASDKNAIDFRQVLDQPAPSPLAGRPSGRYVHGIVSHFTQGSSGFRRTRYELLLEPQLARLELCCNWRIFQEKSVPEILQALLKEHRVLDYEQRIYHEHLPREYCVQAGDSDHYLHDRLAFEEGLVYYFRFDEHRTPWSAATGSTSRSVSPAARYCSAPSRRATTRSRCFILSATAKMFVRLDRPAGLQLQAPDLRPGASSRWRGARASGLVLRALRLPGRYKQSGAAGLSAKAASEDIGAMHGWHRSAATTAADPGHAFALEGHPRADFNAWWRPVRVVHRGTQYAGQEEESADAPLGVSYDLRAELVPEDVEWRPAPLPRPRIDGPQIATVVGPAGEEIHCDEWGRVKVQFPWDREGRHDEFSTCWIRVAQNWAGADWDTWRSADWPGGDRRLPGRRLRPADRHRRTYRATNRPPTRCPTTRSSAPSRARSTRQPANELRIDDTTAQISAALMSDHGASALHLGYLTHPRPKAASRAARASNCAPTNMARCVRPRAAAEHEEQLRPAPAISTEASWCRCWRRRWSWPASWATTPGAPGVGTTRRRSKPSRKPCATSATVPTTSPARATEASRRSP